MNAAGVSKKWFFYRLFFLSAAMNGAIGSFFIVYLYSKGVNPAQIGFLLAVQRIITVIFEFPTGVFADRRGKRKSLLISFSLAAIVSLLWYFADDLIVFFALSMLGAVAYTFQSGTKESLMIESLGLGDDESRDKMFSKLSVFGNAGFMIGSGLASFFVFLFSLKVFWLVALVFNLAVFLSVLYFVPKDKAIFLNLAQKRSNIWSFAKDSVVSTGKSSVLVALLIVSMVFTVIIAGFGIMYPIEFKRQFLPDFYFGLIGILVSAMAVIGALVSKKMSHRFGYAKSISVLAVVLFISLFVFAVTKQLKFSFFAFIFAELAIGGWFPVFQSFLNKHISNLNRTSVLSFVTTMSLIAMAVGESLFGFFLNYVPVRTMLLYVSFLTLLIPFLFPKGRRAA